MSQHHNERPELTPDRNVEQGVEETFPASDPVAATASQGSRAVPLEQMMQSSKGQAEGCVTVQARFRDREAAKLALETLVREGPIDRSHAEILPGDDAVTLRFAVPQGDAKRLGEMAREYGGA